MNSINSKINYNVKLQCHKCCNEFKREFEAYEHQVNIHKLEFAQDIDHVSNFLVSADNDTVVLYIDTTKDVEDEEMEVEETWEKLAIYKWQDQQDFKLKHFLFQFEDDAVVVAGWGAVKFLGPASEILMEGTIKVVTNQECSDKFSAFRRGRTLLTSHNVMMTEEGHLTDNLNEAGNLFCSKD